MRVLQVSHYRLGGIETHLDTVVTSLTGRGIEVYCVSESRFLRSRSRSAICQELICTFEPWTGEHLTDLTIQCSEFIKKNKIDVVHLHGYHACLVGALAGLATATPYVLTFHGIVNPAQLAREFGTALFLIFTRLVVPYAAGVLAVKEGARDSVVQAFDLDAHNIELFRNPVDLAQFDFAVRQPPSTPVAVFLSHLVPVKECSAKGALDLFAVLKRQRADWRFCVAGGGKSLPVLRSHAQRLGLDVEFLGFRHDVAELMRDCHLVVGMGRVAIEGMASRRLVVVPGYDGGVRVITPDTFFTAQRNNFNGDDLPRSDTEATARLVNNVVETGEFPYDELRSMVAKDHDSRVAAERLEGLYGGASRIKGDLRQPGLVEELLRWSQEVGTTPLKAIEWWENPDGLPSVVWGGGAEKAV